MLGMPRSMPAFFLALLGHSRTNVIIVQMDVPHGDANLRVAGESLNDGKGQHFCPPGDPGVPEIVNNER